jgi:hypothetical protein
MYFTHVLMSGVLVRLFEVISAVTDHIACRQLPACFLTQVYLPRKGACMFYQGFWAGSRQILAITALVACNQLRILQDQETDATAGWLLAIAIA